MAVIEVRTDSGEVVWSVEIIKAPKVNPDWPAARTWWKVTDALNEALRKEGRG